MNFKEYQKLANRTAGDYPISEHPFWVLVSACGIAGEAGEVTDYLKKVYGHKHEVDLVKLKKELGDVQWYIADLATKHGLDLEDIAVSNIEKLKQRYPEGFNSHDSINRKDKMKVYVVAFIKYDDFEVLKVFFKKENAELFKEDHADWRNIYIYESEIE